MTAASRSFEIDPDRDPEVAAATRELVDRFFAGEITAEQVIASAPRTEETR